MKSSRRAQNRVVSSTEDTEKSLCDLCVSVVEKPFNRAGYACTPGASWPLAFTYST